jgi:protein-tyrosine phosphatase
VIDTHCHLLHSLDDGPKTEDDSVELARQLAKAGVRAVICTPHFSRRFRTELRPALQRITQLERLLLEAPIALALTLAAEVSPAFAVSEPMEELLPRTMGGRFLLVELEPDTPAAFLETAVDRLAGERLSPVFAHPERCRSVREQPRLLEEARAAGALIQVVAPSLTGRWGKDVGVAAWKLLDAGVVDLLGSDSHRPAETKTHLEVAAAEVEARYGREVLAELTEREPLRLLSMVAREG